MAQAKTRIVIVGGGCAGHTLAYNLQKKAEVTLIDPKDYFEFPIAVPRLLVQPDKLQAQIPFAEFLPQVKLVQGFATDVDDQKKVVTVKPANVKAGGDGDGVDQKAQLVEVGYDYLILASGSRYRGGLFKSERFTVKERKAEIHQVHEALVEAKHVAVVGSGAVGVEVVGELVCAFPDKKITVIDSSPKISFGPKEFPGWIADYYKQHNVATEFGSRVASPAVGTLKANEVVLENGKRIDADVIIWSAGTTPNTEFLRNNFADQLTQHGLVKTSLTLQVPNHPNIFVVGDITDLPEAKLAFIAGFHVKHLLSNLNRLLSKGDKAVLAEYKPSLPTSGTGGMMMLTLGTKGGLASFPFGAFRAHWIVSKVKGQDMFVGKVRSEIGLK